MGGDSGANRGATSAGLAEVAAPSDGLTDVAAGISLVGAAPLPFCDLTKYPPPVSAASMTEVARVLLTHLERIS